MNPQARIPGANQCAFARLCKGNHAEQHDRTELIVPHVQENRLMKGHQNQDY